MPAIIKMILGFGLVIFLHELGHFLMARKNGVYVEKFAIGFDWPIALARWRRGDTEYVIGALPLGGYVKMLGQHDLPSETADPERLDPDSFQAKTVWQRTQIISAGVIANFLSAFVLCYIAFVIGFHAAPPGVGAVGFDSLAAGLRPGDVVKTLDGRAISSWDDLFVTYATLEPGSEATFVIERDGAERVVKAPVNRDPDDPFNLPDFGRPVIPRVKSVWVDSAADKAGIKPGDWLVAVDGNPITSWAGFSSMIQRRGDKETTVTVRRKVGKEEQVLELTATPESKPPDEIPAYTLGFEPAEPAIVSFVAPEGPSAAAGVQEGDRIVSVNGAPVTSWYELWKVVSWDVPEGQPITLGLDRADQPLSVSVTPVEPSNWAVGTHALSGLGVSGDPPDVLEIGVVAPGSPAAKAGLQSGDKLRQFKAHVRGDDDWTVSDPTWDTLLYALNSLEVPEGEAGVKPMALEIDRGGKRHSFEIPPTKALTPERVGFLGVGAMIREDFVRLGAVEAILPALRKPFQILDSFASQIRALFMRRMSARGGLSGPIGILRATYIFAEKSTGDLLLFLALLSVNLAIVNFLPIPITDGGHFMFLMYEKFKGRQMDEEMQARFQWAGLVFILMVFLFATFNDVGMIFGF